MQTYYFKNATLYAQEETIHNPAIKVGDGKLVSLSSISDAFSESGEEVIEEIEFPEPVHIVPGFIDCHIHGAAGADVMDGTEEALHTMSRVLPEEGTTSFLATTLTQSPDQKLAALNAVRQVMAEGKTTGATIAGVHLEGPFICEVRSGAQPKEHIRKADTNLFDEFHKASGEGIKLVTMAPEEDEGGKLLQTLIDRQVLPSIGHSDASYEQVLQAVEKGVTHVTHLFNGMRGAHHRDIGVAGGALLHDELMVEMIADGIHISPPMVKLAYKAKGADRIILITDAMCAKGLGQGEFSLGGQKVHVSEDRVLLENGTLAGSILKMNDAVKNMMAYTGCTLRESVQMASLNPARQLGIEDKKGSLKAGKDADFCILSEKLDVLSTYVKGKKVYEESGQNEAS